MINVTCEVPVYEVDHKETSKILLVVHSHWNIDRFVVIETPGGQRLTVNAADLKAAIENATNTKRF